MKSSNKLAVFLAMWAAVMGSAIYYLSTQYGKNEGLAEPRLLSSVELFGMLISFVVIIIGIVLGVGASIYIVICKWRKSK